ETVAGRHLRAAIQRHGDVVPVRKAIPDPTRADRVVRFQIGQRLVGKDDAPAEGVSAPVALEDMDVVLRVPKLHRDGEIDAGGTAAKTSNTHETPPVALGLK